MKQQVTKYCWKEEKLLLRSNFSSFPQYFQYISNVRSKIAYTFVKCGCSIYFSLILQTWCRSTDISKYFRESLGIRDNKSWRYSISRNTMIVYKWHVHKRNDQNESISLTHWRLDTPKWVTGKQCRLRSDAALDAAECGVWSGCRLFSNSSTIFLWDYLYHIACTPKMENGLLQ